MASKIWKKGPLSREEEIRQAIRHVQSLASSTPDAEGKEDNAERIASLQKELDQLTAKSKRS